MRRRRALGAMAIAAALAATGCSSTSGSGERTLSVWIMEGTNAESKAFFRDAGAEFTKRTGAKLDVQYLQWSDAHDRFVTAIAGGTAPDVAETGTTWTPEFADAGALSPIDDDVKKAGLQKDLVPGLKESGSYAGALYGMPWYAGVRALVYRADVFAELGISAPTTWNELASAAERIKTAKPEMIPFAVPGEAEFSLYPWVWGAGGDVATQKGATWKSGLDGPNAREGIRFYTDLATKKGLSSVAASTWKETDVLDNFVSGKLAMTIQGSWTPSAIAQRSPEMKAKVGAAPLPGRDGGIMPSVLGGSHLSIFATTKQRDLSWQFVTLMTTGRFAERWGKQTGFFPGLNSLIRPAIASKDPLVAPFATQMTEGGAAVPVTPKFGALQAKKTSTAMLQSILTGRATVEQATSQAAREMTDVLNGK